MKRIVTVSISMVLWVGVAFVAGLKIGFDQAMVHSFFVDAPARGALAVHQLNALRSGRTDFLVTFLENSVDQSILWHNDLLNSNWAWLLG